MGSLVCGERIGPGNGALGISHQKEQPAFEFAQYLVHKVPWQLELPADLAFGYRPASLGDLLYSKSANQVMPLRHEGESSRDSFGCRGHMTFPMIGWHFDHARASTDQDRVLVLPIRAECVCEVVHCMLSFPKT